MTCRNTALLAFGRLVSAGLALAGLVWQSGIADRCVGAGQQGPDGQGPVPVRAACGRGPDPQAAIESLAERCRSAAGRHGCASEAEPAPEMEPAAAPAVATPPPPVVAPAPPAVAAPVPAAPAPPAPVVITTPAPPPAAPAPFAKSPPPPEPVFAPAAPAVARPQMPVPAPSASPLPPFAVPVPTWRRSPCPSLRRSRRRLPSRRQSHRCPMLSMWRPRQQLPSVDIEVFFSSIPPTSRHAPWRR